jgi:predicted nucleic acid-binding protein
VPAYLADTSAWNRSTFVADLWQELLERGELFLCIPVRLELLFSARNRREYHALADELNGLPVLALDVTSAALASRTLAMLADRSQHRGPRPIDLLIAAIAERHTAVLLHYDRHFDAIGRVSGQAMEWVARRGSLD